MQDMTPRNDRSIRNIPISNNHHRRTAPKEDEERTSPTPSHHKKRSRSRIWKWALLVVVVSVAAGLLLSTLFEGAEITVTPKTRILAGPITLQAQANPTGGALGYQKMTLSASATTTVKATSMEHVSKSASGIITIYNEYSTASQQLIVNTRFQSPDGKIYRVHVPVLVPGQKKNADGTLTKGSVSVTVYADKPGDAYNLPADVRFTIPGFTGDARYTKFYAVSQGPISGGFVGEQPGVSPADATAAHNALQEQLKTTLLSGAAANLPEGFHLVEDSQKFVFTDMTRSSVDGSTADLAEGAQATFVIIRGTALAAAAAKQEDQGYKGEAIDFLDPARLSLKIASTTKTSDPITFTINGTPVLVWQIDAEALKAALIGKEKTSFETIVQTFQPEIVKAEASIRPFWKSVFPSDENKITVTIQN